MTHCNKCSLKSRVTWILKDFKLPVFHITVTYIELCNGGHFNHGLYVISTLQAPEKEEAEGHGRRRNAENRALVPTLTLDKDCPSLCGEKP